MVPPLPPPNWMGLSIFSLIFCTLPFGIIALFVSCMVMVLFFLFTCLIVSRKSNALSAVLQSPDENSLECRRYLASERSTKCRLNAPILTLPWGPF